MLHLSRSSIKIYELFLKEHFQIFVLNVNVPLYEMQLQVNSYTVKFDIMEPSVPLVKFVKIPLYQEFRYIEGKLIIDYDNPF